jgi:tetratricopeptide (TPR) repeat protein
MMSHFCYFLVRSLALLTACAAAALNVAASQSIPCDSSEYKGYLAASAIPDRDQRVDALKTFIDLHPADVLRIRAQEGVMAAYQEKGDQKNLVQAVGSILQSDPDNVRALAVAADLGRHGTDSRIWGTQALRGIEALESWSKPECMSTSEFAKIRDGATTTLYGAAGAAALQSKEYSKARDYYRKALAIEPTNLLNMYELGVAELEMNPIETVGFRHIATAIHLAKQQGNLNAAASISVYGKKKYRIYYGTESGWDEIVGTETSPPL